MIADHSRYEEIAALAEAAAGGIPQFLCWKRPAQLSTPTSSWNSHPTQAALPAAMVGTYAAESAENSMLLSWMTMLGRVSMQGFEVNTTLGSPRGIPSCAPIADSALQDWPCA
jgi:hypothetical protein